MIVFFPSCELVEFYYTLFVQTLLPRPGAVATAPLPPGSTQLKFLRLHGGLEQEVSSTRSPGGRDPAHLNSSSRVRELPWQAPPGAGRLSLPQATHRTWTPVPPPCQRGGGAYCSRPPTLPKLGARRPTWPASASASC